MAEAAFRPPFGRNWVFTKLARLQGKTIVWTKLTASFRAAELAEFGVHQSNHINNQGPNHLNHLNNNGNNMLGHGHGGPMGPMGVPMSQPGHGGSLLNLALSLVTLAKAVTALIH